MNTNEDIINQRIQELKEGIKTDSNKYLRHARRQNRLSGFLSWLSALFGLSAAVFGLIPWSSIEKWQVGLLAAMSATIITISRQLGLQIRANWHYRKTSELDALQRQLQFELPAQPTIEQVAAISRAWSAVDRDMRMHWEDIRNEGKGGSSKSIKNLTDADNQ